MITIVLGDTKIIYFKGIGQPFPPRKEEIIKKDFD